MPRIEFPNFCGGHGDLGNTNLVITPGISPLEASVCQNLYVHTLDVGRQRKALIGRPGLNAPLVTLGTSPVRGLIAGQDQTQNPILYAASGSTAYSITGGGVATSLGAIPNTSSTGPCRIVANGASSSIAPGSQLQVFMDYGATTGNLSAFNGTNMVSLFTARDLEYLDGFMVAIANGVSLQTSNPNQINVSAFGDHTNWTPGPSSTQAFAIRTGSSDHVNALAVLNGFLWIFGQRTTELWYNAGLSPFPFQRYQGATLNFGCMSPFSVVKFWDRVIWLSQDHTGYPQVLMSQGMNAKKISNNAISAAIAAFGVNSFLLNAWAYGYQEYGHNFYVLQPWNGSAFANLVYSVVYDIDEDTWHVRLWGGARPIAIANAVAINYAGDGLSGQVLPQTITTGQDKTTGGAAQTITYLRQAPYVTDMNRVSRVGMFELIGDLGINAPTLSYSDDWGTTYRTPFSLTAPSSDQGFFTAGNLKRYYARQLGRQRARIYQVNLTSSTNPIRIAGAYLNIDQGIEP